MRWYSDLSGPPLMAAGWAATSAGRVQSAATKPTNGKSFAVFAIGVLHMMSELPRAFF